jgi:hypothetical protein
MKDWPDLAENWLAKAERRSPDMRPDRRRAAVGSTTSVTNSDPAFGPTIAGTVSSQTTDSGATKVTIVNVHHGYNLKQVEFGSV